MQLSKLTFSLASLVLLMALVAMPVMAHVLTPANTVHNPVDTEHPAHPILDSVTAMGPAADGFVNNSTSFLVEFKFSGAAPTDFDATDITGGTDTDFSGSGLVYTARFTLSGDATIGVNANGVTVPGALYVDQTNEKRQVAIEVDNAVPALTGGSTSAAKMQVVNGRRPAPPANGQWGPADFDIEFSIMDADSGLDAGSIMIADDQDPHVLSFSNIGETATPGIYAAIRFQRMMLI